MVLGVWPERPTAVSAVLLVAVLAAMHRLAAARRAGLRLVPVRPRPARAAAWTGRPPAVRSTAGRR